MSKFKWLWHWIGKNGKQHLTTSIEEAEKSLHNNDGETIWAERVPENGIKKFKNLPQEGVKKFGNRSR